MINVDRVGRKSAHPTRLSNQRKRRRYGFGKNEEIVRHEWWKFFCNPEGTLLTCLSLICLSVARAAISRRYLNVGAMTFVPFAFGKMMGKTTMMLIECLADPMAV
ncbi:MAG: hypothetical protein P4L91_04205 [Burkholderiaceae bacterium]|nr:hypothetical protein [Burkholderiaceae bacterium]